MMLVLTIVPLQLGAEARGISGWMHLVTVTKLLPAEAPAPQALNDHGYLSIREIVVEDAESLELLWCLAWSDHPASACPHDLQERAFVLLHLDQSWYVSQ